MGFASGMPFLLDRIGFCRTGWPKLDVDLTTIGIFGLVGIPYALKFAWAPLVDRNAAAPCSTAGSAAGEAGCWQPQLGVLLSTLLLAFSNPAAASWLTAVAAVGKYAFFSATQDIAIDAYRIEILHGR